MSDTPVSRRAALGRLFGLGVAVAGAALVAPLPRLAEAASAEVPRRGRPLVADVVPVRPFTADELDELPWVAERANAAFLDFRYRVDFTSDRLVIA